MYNFSNAIKELRESRNITQSELANKLGITKSMVSAYETATRSPSYDVLIKIARFFDVSMDYMFGFDSDNIVINVRDLSDKEKKIIRELIEAFKENKRFKG